MLDSVLSAQCSWLTIHPFFWAESVLFEARSNEDSEVRSWLFGRAKPRICELFAF